MKKLIIVIATLFITMFASSMVVYAGSEELKQDAQGVYWYYNNGVKDTTKSGMVEYDGGLFVIIDGKLRTDFNGMCLVPGVEKWYFFSQGQVQKDWIGFAEYNGAWFYLDEGELDSTKTGIYEYDGGYFLLAEGRLINGYSGLYENTLGENKDNKWYYFANGQYQVYTGIASYDKAFFYLFNGCLADDVNGAVEYDNAYFNISNGMVTGTATSQDVIRNPLSQTKSAITELSVYNAMISLEDEYPEGMEWTNDNYYRWKGGIYSGGYGCAGFAFRLSDEAFGSLRATKHTDVNNIKVGDILRVNDNTHSVIVLEVSDDRIVIAEGNYNYSIHWGRTMTRTQLENNCDYVMTRWP